MATKYTARQPTIVALSAELNSLANNTASAVSAILDNTSPGMGFLYTQIQVDIAAQGGNRTTGAFLALYLVTEVDGTNYGSTVDECLDNYFVGTVSLDDASSAARIAILDKARLPVGDFKVVVKNGTGQALAATGNTVSIRAYTVEDAA